MTLFVVKPNIPLLKQLEDWQISVSLPRRATVGQPPVEISTAEIRLRNKKDASITQPLLIETPTLPLYGVSSPEKHAFNKAYTTRITSNQSEWLASILGDIQNEVYSQLIRLLVQNPAICPRICAKLIQDGGVNAAQHLKPFFSSGEGSQYIRFYDRTAVWFSGEKDTQLLNELEPLPGQGYYRLRLRLSNIFLGAHGTTSHLASITARGDQILYHAALVNSLNNLQPGFSLDDFNSDVTDKLKVPTGSAEATSYLPSPDPLIFEEEIDPPMKPIKNNKRAASKAMMPSTNNSLARKTPKQ